MKNKNYIKTPLACALGLTLCGQLMAKPRITNEEMNAPSRAAGLATGLLNLALHGAHHVPLQMQHGLQDYWATSDYAINDQYDSDLGLLEIGMAQKFMDGQLIAGFGLGQSWMDQDLPVGGDADLDGQYLLGELSYQASGSPLVYTLSGSYGMWDADITRGYAGGPSFGSTDIDAAALRLRVDWLDAATLAGFSVSPKIEYSYQYGDMDGYSEIGGGTPAIFADQSDSSHQLRYGFSGTREVLEGKGLLRLRAEGVYRFDGSTAQTVATNLGPFVAAGPNVKQHWALLGADLDYAYSDTITLSGGVMAATDGDDPTLGFTIGARVSF